MFERGILFYILLLFASVTTAQKPGDKVLSIYVDEYDHIWFGTDKGLLRKSGDTWKAFNTTPGSPGRVNDIKHPNTGDPELLLGTTTGIIKINYSASDIHSSAFFNSSVTSFHTDSINALEFDNRNVSYFTTPEGIGIFASAAWRFYTRFFDIVRDKFTSVKALGDTIYLGTQGEGVARIVRRVDGYTGASAYILPWSALTGDSITSIFIDSKGCQWYGTTKGISRHSSTEPKEDWDNSLTDQLPNHHVTAISGDPEGNLWIGTADGLVEFSNDLNKIKTWNVSNGLPSGVINNIFICKDKSVWIGTDLGASHFNGSAFSNIRTSDYARNFVDF